MTAKKRILQLGLGVATAALLAVVPPCSASAQDVVLFPETIQVERHTGTFQKEFHIDIDDDGTIHIAAADASACDAAKKCIDDIVFVPEIGKLYYGRVVRLMTFGAFVELAPGKDGLVHISKLADKRIEKVEDACKVGDMMWVKFMEIDEKGRWNLSHKDAMKEIRAKEAAGEKIQ